MDDPNAPANPIDTLANIVPTAAQDQLKNDAGAIAGEARDVIETARHEAADQFAVVKEQAQSQIAEATDKAKSFAAEQKDVAGDQLGGIADAISKVADDIAGDQPMVAGYARDLAGGMKSVSDSVKSRNVDELIGMAEDFGRKQPLAFLGAAALAGFVASRFVLASAQRRTAGNAPGAATPGSTQGDL